MGFRRFSGGPKVNQSRRSWGPRLGCALGGIALALGMLVAPNAASAFTYENNTSSLTGPQFDIEEQARLFNTPKAELKDTTSSDKNGIETPYGTLKFGVGPGATPFGSTLSPTFNMRAREDQRHFDRITSPVPVPEGFR